MGAGLMPSRGRSAAGEPALVPGFDRGRELGRACPGMLVVVGERESDVHGLLRRQAEHAAEAGLAVRAAPVADG